MDDRLNELLAFSSEILPKLIFSRVSVKSIFFLLIPALITATLYERSKQNFSDYLYYVILDGLMMFSGLLMLILGI